MTPTHQITMLKFIKNLSMLSTTLESLHSADAIDELIDVLDSSMRKKHFREISNQVLNTLFNLCRLDKERQEYAAVNGIIPPLLSIMRTEHPPKEFALPILCDMAHSGPKGRRYLWLNQGLDFFVSLLADQYWQVTALDAIFIWLASPRLTYSFGHAFSRLSDCRLTTFLGYKRKLPRWRTIYLGEISPTPSSAAFTKPASTTHLMPTCWSHSSRSSA